MILAPYENNNDPYEIREESKRDSHEIPDDLMSTRSEVAKNIIFATDMTNAKSDYYLRGDPVSLIITNIPSFKGGRANPWMESDN